MLICPDAVLLFDPPFFDNKENNIKELWQILPTLITKPIMCTSNLPLEFRALEAIFTHVVC